MSRQTALTAFLLIVGAAVFLAIPVQLPDRIGSIDFRPYWSSTFLLARGQDFSDSTKMDQVERTLTGWTESYTMSAWFAPSGNLILLPYTLFPFPRAVYYWALTNIVVIFFSTVLIWRGVASHLWVPLLATFSFSMSLISLMFGQVNTLILFGLALFLFFSATRREALAGASLVLTTIKPHLVILTLPLLFLDLLKRREWRMLAGFAGALATCAVLLFCFDLAWPVHFWHIVTSGMSSTREAPTLAGLLVMAGDHTWAKWLWLVGLFAAIALWWKWGKKDGDQRSLIDLSILAGMMIAPIGWSYDQIMLLLPILHVLQWMVKGLFSKQEVLLIVVALVLINALTFYERILSLSEVWFFWVPFGVAAIYLFAKQREQASLARLAKPI